MSKFRQVLWAAVERIVPRGASASLLLLLAVFSFPDQVGVYGWAVLGITLYQSCTDVAARQIAVIAVRSGAGRLFLRKFAFASALSGSIAMVVVVGCLIAFVGSDLRASAIALSPLVLVPIATSMGIAPVARLQVAQRWRYLARGQVVAGVAALAITAPILIYTHSIGAAALQPLLSEALVTLWARRGARSVPLEVGGGVRSFRRGVGFLSLDGVLGWSQAQLDRVLIGAYGGLAQLGLYSMAGSIARAVGDASAAAVGNVLRSRLASSSGATPQSIERFLFATLAMGAGIYLAVGGVAGLVLPEILGPQWAASVAAIPVLAASVFPALMTWSSTAIAVTIDRTSSLLPGRAVGIIGALPIALLAVESLQAAAMAAVARDLVVMIAFGVGLGRSAPWRAMMAALVLTILAAVGSLAFSASWAS